MSDRLPLPGVGEGNPVVDALDALDARHEARHEAHSGILAGVRYDLRYVLAGAVGGLVSVSVVALLLVGAVRGVNVERVAESAVQVLTATVPE